VRYYDARIHIFVTISSYILGFPFLGFNTKSIVLKETFRSHLKRKLS